MIKKRKRGLLPGKDFPTNDYDFDALFSTEERCRQYIYEFGRPKEDENLQVESLWPWRLGKEQTPKSIQGGKIIQCVCPECNSSKKPDITDQGYVECTENDCNCKIALTAGTLFHNQRKPLTDWFRAIWLILKNDGLISGKQLQRELSLGCYQTALKWRYSIRKEMGKIALDPLFPSHLDLYFNVVAVSKIGGVRSKQSLLDSYLLVVVVSDTTKPKTYFKILNGSLDRNSRKLNYLYDKAGLNENYVISNQDHVLACLDEFWKGYCLVADQNLIKFNGEIITKRVEAALNKLESWLKQMPHGYVEFDQLDLCLKEFCFRKNYQYPKKYGVGSLFYHFMEIALPKYKK